ncbi:MAG: glycosyltransferase family A protein [Candidatus Falkowbacteria bacterium]
MISVIIPVYNQADKITTTLDSLIKQSYQDLEIIIVNDGSRDGLDLVLENYFKTIETKIGFMVLHQANGGAPAARNAGFKKSRGEYLFFCDADAVLDYQALEIMLASLNTHPEVSYVFSSFYWGKKLFRLEEFSESKLKQMPYIHTMSLIRRSNFPATGWDESIKKLQDWDLWLTMLEAGHRGLWIDQILFKVTPGGHISSWLPAAAYSLFPFLPQVQKYNAALKIVKTKHHLL